MHLWRSDQIYSIKALNLNGEESTSQEQNAKRGGGQD